MPFCKLTQRNRTFKDIMAHCANCLWKLDMRRPVPFYTVVIDHRIRRVCPTCFKENEFFQYRWMG